MLDRSRKPSCIGLVALGLLTVSQTSPVDGLVPEAATISITLKIEVSVTTYEASRRPAERKKAG
jgi:hypothetical protein